MASLSDLPRRRDNGTFSYTILWMCLSLTRFVKRTRYEFLNYARCGWLFLHCCGWIPHLSIWKILPKIIHFSMLSSHSLSARWPELAGSKTDTRKFGILVTTLSIAVLEEPLTRVGVLTVHFKLKEDSTSSNRWVVGLNLSKKCMLNRQLLEIV